MYKYVIELSQLALHRPPGMKKKSKIPNMISRGSAFMRLALIRTKAFMAYCTTGVWSDTRRSWRINTIKTINLTVRSFLNTDLQKIGRASCRERV